jgi:hypothetical protein
MTGIIKISMVRNIAKWFWVVGIVLAPFALRAQPFTFSFTLDQHIAGPPESFGYGTIAYQPGALTLDLTYSVSAPVQEIVFWTGRGLLFDFYWGTPPEPSATGTFVTTRSGAFVNQSLLDALQAGSAGLARIFHSH